MAVTALDGIGYGFRPVGYVGVVGAVAAVLLGRRLGVSITQAFSGGRSDCRA